MASITIMETEHDMKDLLDKLSSYNIFNYLLPGVIFAVIGTEVSAIKFLVDDIVVGFFLYYFYGLVVSRIGSLLLQPFLKKIKFVRFTTYSDFVAASRADDKLEVLSEQNNMFRTLASTFFCLLILLALEWLHGIFPNLYGHAMQSTLVLLLVLFVWSYRKQTAYVVARVAEANKNPSTPSTHK